MRFFIFFSLKKLEISECFNWWKMELKPNTLSSLVFLLTWMMLKVHSAHSSMPAFCPAIQWWHEVTRQIDLRAEQDRRHCHHIRPSILPLLLFKSFINLPGWRHRGKDKFRATLRCMFSKHCMAKSPTTPSDTNGNPAAKWKVWCRHCVLSDLSMQLWKSLWYVTSFIWCGRVYLKELWQRKLMVSGAFPPYSSWERSSLFLYHASNPGAKYCSKKSKRNFIDCRISLPFIYSFSDCIQWFLIF